MKKIKLILGILIVASLVFSLNACNKEDASINTDKEINLASDEALSDKLFSDVKDIVDEAMGIGLKSTEIDTIFMGPCVVKTIDTIGIPHTITIDFGETNCLCRDGRYRRGKIMVHYTGRYRQVGTVITHTFDNYFVNDNQLLGTKIVTNQGFNSNNNMTWTISVNGQVIKANNGGTITRVAERMREWSEGIETPHRRWDDVYLLTGTSTITREDGSMQTSTITTALKKKMNCHWIVSGIIEMQRTGKPLKVMDYGDGQCDDLATVTVNGETRTIHLR
ncbi:MAG: hypothetical protein Q7J34_11945 [Bacteroidales bacterium]|jgi:hypothetical protein|nr:hypothetical protein [Bacteroidales bacterium]